MLSWPGEQQRSTKGVVGMAATTVVDRVRRLCANSYGKSTVLSTAVSTNTEVVESDAFLPLQVE